jgi:hypothetical protein
MWTYPDSGGLRTKLLARRLATNMDAVSWWLPVAALKSMGQTLR